jgi:hypothetical protein
MRFVVSGKRESGVCASLFSTPSCLVPAIFSIRSFLWIFNIEPRRKLHFKLLFAICTW